MITFIIALLVLVGGYFLYGSYVERVFGPDKIRKTPALTMADGVDFIPLPTWKIFMIQFLNIGIDYAMEYLEPDYIIIANPDIHVTDRCIKRLHQVLETEEDGAVASSSPS